METILLALLSAVGLAALLWLLLGALLLPAGTPETLRVCVLAHGSGNDVEHTLRALGWLRGAGLLRARVVVADAGLNGAGRAQVEYLCARRFPEAHFVHTNPFVRP